VSCFNIFGYTKNQIKESSEFYFFFLTFGDVKPPNPHYAQI
jgi:hypothetical protein